MNGSRFIGNEQLIEWTVPAGGIAQGSVVTIDMIISAGFGSKISDTTPAALFHPYSSAPLPAFEQQPPAVFD